MNGLELAEACEALVETAARFPTRALARMLVSERIRTRLLGRPEDQWQEQFNSEKESLVKNLAELRQYARLVAAGKRAKALMDRLDRGETLPRPRRRRRTANTRRTR